VARSARDAVAVEDPVVVEGAEDAAVVVAAAATVAVYLPDCSGVKPQLELVDGQADVSPW
jgi:hypothetical protein